MAKKHDGEAAATTGGQTVDEALAALLHDLADLNAYLTERGQHTYELAQRFMEHARQDATSRAYDERQATMLEYQHYLWYEIAGLVNQLVVRYGAEPEATDNSNDQEAQSPAPQSQDRQDKQDNQNGRRTP